MLYKRITFLLILFISLKDSSAQNCPLADEYFRFNNGWQIKDTSIQDSTTNTQKKFHRGHGIIFRYKAIYDCPKSFDEEGIDVLTWYIPDSLTNFKLDLIDSLKPNGNLDYYFLEWGIVPKEYKLIKISGSIIGTKEKNSWNVSGKLKIVAGNLKKTFARDINFSKSFTISKGKRKPEDPFYWEGKQFY